MMKCGMQQTTVCKEVYQWSQHIPPKIQDILQDIWKKIQDILQDFRSQFCYTC